MTAKAEQKGEDSQKRTANRIARTGSQCGTARMGQAGQKRLL
jgi:hypothetical protein